MNPARNRREFISATEQIGDKDSLQETGHHQGQAEGEEHIWRRVSDTRWGHKYSCACVFVQSLQNIKNA